MKKSLFRKFSAVLLALVMLVAAIPNLVSHAAPVAATIIEPPTVLNILEYGQNFGDVIFTGGRSIPVEGYFGLGAPRAAGTMIPMVSNAVGVPVRFYPNDTTNYTQSAQLTVKCTVVPSTKLTITTAPTAGSVGTGTKLSDISLNGGTAMNYGRDVEGSFSWVSPNTIVTESGTYEVKFIPQAYPERYNTPTAMVQVDVIKPEAKVNSWPTASAITYGQSLSDSALSGGSADVSGEFRWVDENIKPNAGNSAKYAVKFVPTSGDYASVQANIALVVNKAIPQNVQWPTFEQTIIYGKKISEIYAVSGNFSWVSPNTVFNAGKQIATITYTPDDSSNYETLRKDYEITVEQSPTSLSLVAAVDAVKVVFTATLDKNATGVVEFYKPGGVLIGTQNISNSRAVFNWSNPDAGTYNVTAKFVPAANGNYKASEGSTKITVMNKFTVTVIDGSGSGEYSVNDLVTITADPSARSSYEFSGWEVVEGTVDADLSSETTSFNMPQENVTIKANYKFSFLKFLRSLLDSFVGMFTKLIEWVTALFS